MSAHRLTDCRIDCDHPGCGDAAFATHLSLMDPTAAEARKMLKAYGWQVGVGGEDGVRRDFCPNHRIDKKEMSDVTPDH